MSTREQPDAAGPRPSLDERRRSHFRRCIGRLALSGCMLLPAAGWLMLSGRLSALPETGSNAEDKREIKQALARFGPLVGEWRGVGMPKRRSNTGSWTEKAEWLWDFRNDSVSLRYEIDGGKLLDSGRLTYEPGRKVYLFEANFKDNTVRRYEGKSDGTRLVLESPADESGDIHRISITPLNDKRTVVLLEKHREGSSFYRRVAEIGYTRAGTRLAVEGGAGPKCIVTGGRGTIEVSYQGRTYYVCCSGCKQAFEDDPAGVIAEYERNRKSD